MRGIQNMNFHPLANISPLLDGQPFSDLIADIGRNGVLVPIWTLNGEILDGRNRWRASQAAGVDCPMCEYDGDDALGFVLSLNLHRRQMSANQLAYVALDIEKYEAVLAKERQIGRPADSVVGFTPPQAEDAGKAREKAAAAVGGSPSDEQHAKKIESTAPALAEEVNAGGGRDLPLDLPVQMHQCGELRLVKNSFQKEKQDKTHLLAATDSIQMANENNLLYDKFGTANPDDVALAISIQKHGIKEPLVITADGVLLSGHRRLSAAKALCLEVVPVHRLNDVFFNEMDAKTRVTTLRLYNQQREKSPGERLREKMLEIVPEEAHSALLTRRSQIVRMKNLPGSNVLIGAEKKRAAITTRQFLTKAQKVIEENRLYWPLTVRRVHYLLLNDPPLRHDKKPDSKYANDKSSYKALTDLLLRARLKGVVPMESIEDTTRPIQLGGGFSTFEQFVAQETNNFLSGYSRDLMQGQPHHVEIMLEKNALRTVIESVARQYNIPVTTGRGFSSLSPRHGLAQRYRRSGKEGLVILMLTDFDPDGDEIAASFARSMRDDFGIAINKIRPVKVALTAEQVAEYNLPSDMLAKITSPNYKKFLQRYRSTKVAELDAAPVTLLQTKLKEVIESVIDVAEFNAQVEMEKQDSAHIEAYRQVVLEAINGTQD